MLTTYNNLRNFFHGSITTALSNQHVSANDYTKIYIVNLLTHFSKTENFFENTEHGLGLKPLTEYYLDAVYTQSKSQQLKSLQRLGDIALFISGIFPDSLNKKNIDLEFYIAMGENAYCHLSDSFSHQHCINAHQEAFHELGNNFMIFVDILGEIGDQMRSIRHADLLRQYDIWLNTGSKRAGKLLQRFGIDLNALPNPTQKH